MIFKVKNIASVRLSTSAESLVEILNAFGNHAEGSLSPPDHWEEDKRDDYYRKVRDNLNMDAKRMLTRLLTGGYNAPSR